MKTIARDRDLIGLITSKLNRVNRGDSLASVTQRPGFVWHPLEALEERLYLSASDSGDLLNPDTIEYSITQQDDLAQADAALTNSVANNFASSTTHSMSDDTTQVVFIDSSIVNHQVLIDNISAVSSTSSIETVLLDFQQDGVMQITNYLNGLSDISSLHIISHGSEGSLSLGNTSLDTDSLNSTYDLSTWASALTSDADILLYGCNVASGAQGIDFINQLSYMTQADVAASSDLTGHESLNANWDLEFTSGDIESAPIYQPARQDPFTGTLATVQVTNASVDAAEEATIEGGATTDNFVFNAGFARDVTINGQGGLDVLDFSNITSVLTFNIQPRGEVTVQIGGKTVTATGIASVISGAGGDNITYQTNAKLTGSVNGGDGVDTIQGGSKEDTISGGDMGDTIRGGGGGDELHGNEGGDMIYGEAGKDRIYGDAGDDTLNGGPDDDIYRFANIWGRDTIVEGANGGIDKLSFAAATTNLNVTFGSTGAETGLAVAGTNANERVLPTHHIEKIQAGLGTNTFTFNDNWDGWGAGSVFEISNPSAASTPATTRPSTLDFSASNKDLTFTIEADGKVTITDGTKTIIATHIDTLIGGKGDNQYKFTGENASINHLTANPAGQNASKTNIIDYAEYDGDVFVNLTGSQIDYNTTTVLNRLVEGVAGVNQVQTLNTLNSIQPGTRFKLTLTHTNGTYTTDWLDWTDGGLPASALEAELQKLDNITDVDVTGTGTQADPFSVTFQNPETGFN